MHKIVFNIENIEVDIKSNLVFYSSDDIIIYKNNNRISILSCGGITVKEIKCPPDWRHFCVLENENLIILFFSGKYIVSISKPDYFVKEHLLDSDKLGRSTCRPILFENDLILGMSSKGKSQFVRFDVFNEKRKLQTMSWTMPSITNLVSDESKCFGIIDNSMIVSFDPNTFEVFWSKFETNVIGEKIALHNNGVLYSYQNNIKQISENKTNTIKIPFCKVSNIYGSIGDKVYISSNEDKNICCFDTKNDKTDWELKGTKVIRQTVLSTGRYKKQEHPILFVRTDEHFIIIDLLSGLSVYQIKVDGFFDMQISNNSLLLHKYIGRTSIIVGEK